MQISFLFVNLHYIVHFFFFVTWCPLEALKKLSFWREASFLQVFNYPSNTRVWTTKIWMYALMPALHSFCCSCQTGCWRISLVPKWRRGIGLLGSGRGFLCNLTQKRGRSRQPLQFFFSLFYGAIAWYLNILDYFIVRVSYLFFVFESQWG